MEWEAARSAAENHLSSGRLGAFSIPPAPSPAAACPRPARSSTRHWLLNCEIGGGGDVTESMPYELVTGVRTDRGRWRGSAKSEI